jgi:hypothetical protein
MQDCKHCERYAKGGWCDILEMFINPDHGEDCKAFVLFTNADHIRQMDNAELTAFICGINVDDIGKRFVDGVYLPDDLQSIRKWLSRPYEGGTQ